MLYCGSEFIRGTNSHHRAVESVARIGFGGGMRLESPFSAREVESILSHRYFWYYSDKKRMKKVLTLCMVYRFPHVLLGMKKRGFGAGRWNGFGGKVLPEESIEQATGREVFEEAGIQIERMEKFGVLEFEFQKNPEILEVHMFGCNDFSGIPIETEEMRPQWFGVDNIPFSDMWPDDIYWFPLFLAGKKFTGRFFFENDETILKYHLQEVENL